jgi:hypothetical protein
MTDVGIEPGQQSAPEPPATSQEALSPRDAGRLLASLRRPKAEAAEPEVKDTARPAAPTPRAEVALEAPEESPPAGEDAGVEETQPPSETEQVDAAAELPPIAPPRSWTKEDKEVFTTLPRETQERLVERERARDTDISRRQNEAAEKLKGLTAKEQAVEQARQQYESALPILMQNLQSAMAGEFSDIKTMQDVQKMASEDWPRYIRWDAAQKQVAAVYQEVQGAQQRQQTEAQTKFAEFARREGELFAEKVPEMADDIKAAEFQKDAMASLKGVGFEENELAAAWQGRINVPFRDHRVQLMIHKAALWDKAQAKAKTIVNNAKPVPQVQRPGAAQPKGADNAAELKRLETQLDSGKLTVKQQLEVAAKLRSIKGSLMPRKAS